MLSPGQPRSHSQRNKAIHFSRTTAAARQQGSPGSETQAPSLSRSSRHSSSTPVLPMSPIVQRNGFRRAQPGTRRRSSTGRKLQAMPMPARSTSPSAGSPFVSPQRFSAAHINPPLLRLSDTSPRRSKPRRKPNQTQKSPPKLGELPRPSIAELTRSLSPQHEGLWVKEARSKRKPWVTDTKSPPRRTRAHVNRGHASRKGAVRAQIAAMTTMDVLPDDVGPTEAPPTGGDTRSTPGGGEAADVPDEEVSASQLSADDAAPLRMYDRNKLEEERQSKLRQERRTLRRNKSARAVVALAATEPDDGVATEFMRSLFPRVTGLHKVFELDHGVATPDQMRDMLATLPSPRFEGEPSRSARGSNASTHAGSQTPTSGEQRRGRAPGRGHRRSTSHPVSRPKKGKRGKHTQRHTSPVRERVFPRWMRTREDFTRFFDPQSPASIDAGTPKNGRAPASPTRAQAPPELGDGSNAPPRMPDLDALRVAAATPRAVLSDDGVHTDFSRPPEHMFVLRAALDTVPFINAMAVKDKVRLCQRARLREVKKGGILCRAGEAERTFFVVVAGQVWQGMFQLARHRRVTGGTHGCCCAGV